MSEPVLRTEDLRKAYGDKVVLDGIDLAVPEGTIFSLLGPNGAGKTTAVKILSTLITADAGDLHVGGHDLATDPQAVRAAIGVTGQFSAVDGLITGEENMLLMADLHHLSKQEGRRVAAELLERFDLVVTPSVAVPAFEARPAGHSPMTPEAMLGWTPFSYPFNLTQQPACTVPCGLTSAGLPIGLQFVGPMFADPLVLRAARAYEERHPLPRPPI